jgi:hypothetical protein
MSGAERVIFAYGVPVSSRKCIVTKQLVGVLEAVRRELVGDTKSGLVKCFGNNGNRRRTLRYHCMRGSYVGWLVGTVSACQGVVARQSVCLHLLRLLTSIKANEEKIFWPERARPLLEEADCAVPREVAYTGTQ